MLYDLIAINDLKFHQKILSFSDEHVQEIIDKLKIRLTEGAGYDRAKLRDELLELKRKRGEVMGEVEKKIFDFLLQDDIIGKLVRVDDGSNLCCKILYDGMRFYVFSTRNDFTFKNDGDEIDNIKEIISAFGYIPIQYPDPDKVEEHIFNKFLMMELDKCYDPLDDC